MLGTCQSNSCIPVPWMQLPFQSCQPSGYVVCQVSAVCPCVQVYEAVAGLEGDEESVKPYLLVWLHGMDNGSIEPGYLTTIQKRLRHRVIFVVTRLRLWDDDPSKQIGVASKTT